MKPVSFLKAPILPTLVFVTALASLSPALAKTGDVIGLAFYVTGDYGQLVEHTERFTLAGVVELEGAADDPGLTPPYKGVTDTANLADWNAPLKVMVSVGLVQPSSRMVSTRTSETWKSLAVQLTVPFGSPLLAL